MSKIEFLVRGFMVRGLWLNIMSIIVLIQMKIRIRDWLWASLFLFLIPENWESIWGPGPHSLSLSLSHPNYRKIHRLGSSCSEALLEDTKQEAKVMNESQKCDNEQELIFNRSVQVLFSFGYILIAVFGIVGNILLIIFTLR